MKDSQMHVSVIILNWNASSMTIEAVDSILNSSHKDITINIIDNGSTDQSFEDFQNKYQSYDKVKVLKTGKNLGYAGGITYGLNFAFSQDPKYFLIINNDVVIEKSAIKNLIITAEKHNKKALVTGKVYDYSDKNKLQTVGNFFSHKHLKSQRIGFGEYDVGIYDEEKKRDTIDDIFMLMPIEIYQSIGGYSKHFFMNYEQTDFILRAKKRGFYCVYTPEAKLWHKGSFSTGGLGNPKMMFWDSKSYIILHRLHQNRKNFIFFYMKYFYSILLSLSKGFILRCFRKAVNLKSRYAIFLGFIHGTIWLLNKKEDNGYNPFL